MNVAPNKKISSVGMAAIFIATWIAPIWPIEQALHSSLTIVAFIALGWYSKKVEIKDFNFLLIAIFISVHSIAARWLYSNVPYDAWLNAVTGFSIDQYFGWRRNHFDRLVHLLYGFCLTPAIAAYFAQRLKFKKHISCLLAIAIIMITSVWYEWFEWLIAITASEEQAEAYNGQQGDIWDAHKDMLMATVGSAVWLVSSRSMHKK